MRITLVLIVAATVSGIAALAGAECVGRFRHYVQLKVESCSSAVETAMKRFSELTNELDRLV